MTKRYIYMVEGEPYLGTLHDYGQALCNAHYSGVRVSDRITEVCASMWSDDTPAYGQPFHPESQASEPHNDAVTVIIYGERGKGDDERASFWIDLRA